MWIWELESDLGRIFHRGAEDQETWTESLLYQDAICWFPVLGLEACIAWRNTLKQKVKKGSLQYLRSFFSWHPFEMHPVTSSLMFFFVAPWVVGFHPPALDTTENAVSRPGCHFQRWPGGRVGWAPRVHWPSRQVTKQNAPKNGVLWSFLAKLPRNLDHFLEHLWKFFGGVKNNGSHEKRFHL